MARPTVTPTNGTAADVGGLVTGPALGACSPFVLYSASGRGTPSGGRTGREFAAPGGAEDELT